MRRLGSLFVLLTCLSKLSAGLTWVGNANLSGDPLWTTPPPGLPTIRFRRHDDEGRNFGFGYGLSFKLLQPDEKIRITHLAAYVPTQRSGCYKLSIYDKDANRLLASGSLMRFRPYQLSVLELNPPLLLPTAARSLNYIVAISPGGHCVNPKVWFTLDPRWDVTWGDKWLGNGPWGTGPTDEYILPRAGICIDSGCSDFQTFSGFWNNFALVGYDLNPDSVADRPGIRSVDNAPFNGDGRVEIPA